MISFPSGKIHEAVTPNEDGTVTIFLDKNATRESQRQRFWHVMRHLEGNDFKKMMCRTLNMMHIMGDIHEYKRKISRVVHRKNRG